MVYQTILVKNVQLGKSIFEFIFTKILTNNFVNIIFYKKRYFPSFMQTPCNLELRGLTIKTLDWAFLTVLLCKGVWNWNVVVFNPSETTLRLVFLAHLICVRALPVCW